MDEVQINQDQQTNFQPEQSKAAEQLNPAEQLQKKGLMGMKERLEAGLQKPVINKYLSEVKSPIAYTKRLLGEHANPFGGLHLDRVSSVFDDSSGRHRREHGYPTEIPANSSVLIESAAELLGDNPEGMLQEVCASLEQPTSLADIYEDATRKNMDEGLASIQVGEGAYITFPVRKTFVHSKDSPTGKAGFIDNADFGMARFVLEMYGRDDQEKLEPVGMLLVADAVELSMPQPTTE